MKKILFFLYLQTYFVVNSQVLQVNNTFTPQQLVENILAGSGVQIFNVQFNGQAATTITQQAGQFNGENTNLGLNGGIILSSGSINVAPGPNDQGSASEGFAENEINDPDLNDISTNELFDVAVLEFDFIPLGDSVSFKYVFASEEYNEFTCSDYNDVFGFFISGPGINGPFTNGAKNIAIIPGTNTPVAINTVNLGVAGDSGVPSNCEDIDPNWESYNVFFNDNTENSIQYDGMTKVLTAVSEVQCGQIYHIKMALADAGDGSYDSGVFLEAGSLNSIGVDISLKTVTGDTIIYEGCTDAEFIFTRPISQVDNELVVNFSFSGSATENVDYFVNPIGNTITFPIGVDSVTLTLTTVGIIDSNEGDEITTISATFTSECGNQITITKSLIITEEPIISANSNDPVVDCPTDSIIATIEAVGGTPSYQYTWLDENGQIVTQGDTAYISILNPQTLNFTVQITDFCGFSFQKIVPVTLNTKPPLNVSVTGPNATCITPTIPITATGSGGLAPLTYQWNTGEFGPTINASTSGTPPPSYTVTMKDVCGDSIQATHVVVFDPNPTINVQTTNVEIKCPNDQVPISAIASNGFEPYTYTWSDNQVGQTINVGIQTNGTETYTVNVVDICGNTGTANLTLTLNKTLEIDTIIQTPSYLCQFTGTATPEIIGETGQINYLWFGPGANSNNTFTTETLTNQQTGWYYLSIQDEVCDYSDSVFIDFIPNPIANFSIDEPTIDPPKEIIFMNNSLNATNYEWNFGNGETLLSNDINPVSSMYSEVTTYTITLYAYSGPCVDSISKSITILPNPKITEINIFTPNNDGDNDVFSLNALFFKEIIIQVFNRWGNLMFTGDVNKPTWDGLVSGKEASDGVYFYTYKGTGLNGKVLEGQGNVQLTR